MFTKRTNYCKDCGAKMDKKIEIKRNWIPVSERLPKKGVEVLATTRWGAVTIAEMFSANDWLIHEGATNAGADDIVAWMPLPKPYEEKQGNKIGWSSLENVREKVERGNEK